MTFSLIDLGCEPLIQIMRLLLYEDANVDDCVALTLLSNASRPSMQRAFNACKTRLSSDPGIFFFDRPRAALFVEKRSEAKRSRERTCFYHVDSISRQGLVRFRHFAFHHMNKFDSFGCLQTNCASAFCKELNAIYKIRVPHRYSGTVLTFHCAPFGNLTLDDDQCYLVSKDEQRRDFRSYQGTLGWRCRKICIETPLLPVLPPAINTSFFDLYCNATYNSDVRRRSPIRVDAYGYTFTTMQCNVPDVRALFDCDPLAGGSFRNWLLRCRAEVLRACQSLWDKKAAEATQQIIDEPFLP